MTHSYKVTELPKGIHKFTGYMVVPHKITNGKLKRFFDKGVISIKSPNKEYTTINFISEKQFEDLTKPLREFVCAKTYKFINGWVYPVFN